jgi:sulfotransferase
MNFIALSGLPRTGSTVLSAILYQNPNIHVEGLSPLCQLMWDMDQSLSCDYCYRCMLSNNKLEFSKEIISLTVKTYYKDIDRKIILDKCRSWTFPENVNLIKKYIRKDPKIIVMERDVDEIIKSFLYYAKRQNIDIELFKKQLFEPDSEPLMRPLAGYEYAKNNNNGEYFFIDYNDFVENPKKNLDDLYCFLNIEPFDHYFENIERGPTEDDILLNHPGLHEVRPKLSKRDYIF